MSRITSHNIRCPSCDAAISTQLYQSVNVSTDPHLKEKVLSRKINVVMCETCGQLIDLANNLLYHDMEKELMIWLRLDKAREGELQMKHRTLRIVHDFPALVEKIRIFDHGIDDCAMEILKFVIWPQASGKNPEEYRGDEIRFVRVTHGSEGERLLFHIKGEKGLNQFSFPDTEMKKLETTPLVMKAKGNAPRGVWQVVDRDFVLAVI